MMFQRLLPVICAGLIATVFSTGLSSCKKDDDKTPEPPVVTPTSRELSGELTSDKTLTNDSVWTLKGYVYVKEGATLTIPAGTIIKSHIIDKGAIIVERGAKIIAEGTASQPIVFTSGMPQGQRRPGDWGGIIILGKAPTNRSSEPTIEGGVNRNYGGTNPNDTSGILKYVRIEFAGIASAPGSEINGLTLGGVGSGTVIENVMVSYGNDDAFEFFGGTVNAKNLIAWSCLDDDFDFDYGYTGKIQFAISAKHPQFVDNGDASNGIEADNDGSGSLATPFTHPKLSNFTFIGPNNRPNTLSNHNLGNRWRRSVHFTIRNSMIVGHQKGAFSMESEETADSWFNGTSEFKNNIVWAVTRPWVGHSSANTTDSSVRAFALNAANANIELDSANQVMLSNPWSLTAPSFVPQAGSVALSGASFAGLDNFFMPVSFIGAIGNEDWTSGWAEWDPNNASY